MSWTIPIPDEDTPQKRMMDKALEEAASKKVLLFCSAPDGNKADDMDTMYPSGNWADRYFRIGAANSAGAVMERVAENGITFVMPGVDVVRDHFKGSNDTSSKISQVQYDTGSSVATALAAGLAAMIMYCVKASVLALNSANDNNPRGKQFAQVRSLRVLTRIRELQLLVT